MGVNNELSGHAVAKIVVFVRYVLAHEILITIYLHKNVYNTKSLWNLLISVSLHFSISTETCSTSSHPLLISLAN